MWKCRPIRLERYGHRESMSWKAIWTMKTPPKKPWQQSLMESGLELVCSYSFFYLIYHYSLFHKYLFQEISDTMTTTIATSLSIVSKSSSKSKDFKWEFQDNLYFYFIFDTSSVSGSSSRNRRYTSDSSASCRLCCDWSATRDQRRSSEGLHCASEWKGF